MSATGVQRLNLGDNARVVRNVLLALGVTAVFGLVAAYSAPEWRWIATPLQTLCVAAAFAAGVWRLASARQLRHLTIVAALEAGDEPLSPKVKSALNDAYCAMALFGGPRERFASLLDDGFDPASAEQRNALDRLLGLQGGRGVDADDYLVARLSRAPETPEAA